ncbi:no message in thiamine Nmt1 [Schizosaccharomyces octosporus yFS286]|uniref:4-amino-5-hydroxymethyl-2-methylpyrimidine phosphate synthase n=1 Tax=Schizosaccharomyces octosporus (strain yFS286) TaxID=483514 RepID=S9PSA2_SCHOY|nr:no message in thiamine Nmt1 [Schizosaccharomyces octosporus yFS286]EPX70872.1 no message in thiamine Nmt1 [Schizosaccharomyces octosporus yFS286]
MSTNKITFLTNWEATPYHLPIFIAQTRGYFKDEGIEVAILEPTDPSDVTALIGSGKVDMGLKAMIHTLAAKARGFPVTSFGSLLNEPFTGLITLKGNGIKDFKDIKNKRIGYVGEFGKIQLDDLCSKFGLSPSDYTAVRCGMNIAPAIVSGEIDGGIGIECMQQVQLERWCISQGRPRSDVEMLRIDRLAELGCCCFCSILYIAHDDFIAKNPDKIVSFLRAIRSATLSMLENPIQAYKEFTSFKPEMGLELHREQFERCFAYFSRDISNVPRDWNKVTKYSKRLGIVPQDFEPNCTNGYLTWELDPDEKDPMGKQEAIAKIQDGIKQNGGVFSGNTLRYVEPANV